MPTLDEQGVADVSLLRSTDEKKKIGERIGRIEIVGSFDAAKHKIKIKIQRRRIKHEQRSPRAISGERAPISRCPSRQSPALEHRNRPPRALPGVGEEAPTIVSPLLWPLGDSIGIRSALCAPDVRRCLAIRPAGPQPRAFRGKNTKPVRHRRDDPEQSRALCM